MLASKKTKRGVIGAVVLAGVLAVSGYALTNTATFTDTVAPQQVDTTTTTEAATTTTDAATTTIDPTSILSRGLTERCITSINLTWSHDGAPLLPEGYNSNLYVDAALFPVSSPDGRFTITQDSGLPTAISDIRRPRSA